MGFVRYKLVAFLLAAGLSLGTTPFGGRIAIIIPCTANANPTDILIIVGPPRGGSFVKVTSTILYKHYTLLPGHWVLGLASDESVACDVGIPFFFSVTVGVGKKIKFLGTS